MEVIGIMAISLDGFITQGNKPGSAFTSAADKVWFSRILETFSVQVMGSVTFEAERKPITQAVRNSSSKLRLVFTRSPQKYRSLANPGRLEFTDRHPADVLRRIRAEGHERVAVLGGGQIYSLFLRENLLDELWVTLEAKVFGTGTPVFAEEHRTNLNLIEVGNLDPDTLLLKYKPTKKG